jgi:two-component system response regulator YesN
MSYEYSLLVVDDEEAARRYIAEDIDWSRISVGPVCSAENGFDALNKIREKKPDIMIMDLKMPGMNGDELLEELCREKIHLEVITLSGYSDFQAAQKMISSGMVVEYLLKPVSEDQLFEAVYKCVSHIDMLHGILSKEDPDDDGQILELCGQRADEKNMEPMKEGSAVVRNAVREVKDYIRDHYAERITLEKMSSLVFMNASYLSKVFSDLEGKGFSVYLAEVRMERAKEKLMDYRKKIYEVSDEVGYQNVKSFMRVFKKITGKTPSEYRDENMI